MEEFFFLKKKEERERENGGGEKGIVTTPLFPDIVVPRCHGVKLLTSRDARTSSPSQPNSNNNTQNKVSNNTRHVHV